MLRFLTLIAIVSTGATSAALLAYSLGSLALDEFGIASSQIASISLSSAGLIAVLLVIEFLNTWFGGSSLDPDRQRDRRMQHLTRADIVFSVGRGLVMAIAIIGATYYLGSWYLGGHDLEALYRGLDDRIAATVEQGVSADAETAH